MNQIDAFILIGGRSSRMGTEKAAVSIGGLPMRERIRAAIREALGDARIRLVAADHTQILALGGVGEAREFVLDIFPDRGPAGGLYTALANTEKEWIFAAACDLPFLSVELISYLLSKIDGGHDAIVPVQPDGRAQPLAAFYRVSPVRDGLQKRLGMPRPTPSMSEILDEVRVRYIPFAEIEDLSGSARFFTNINSPEDLKGFH